MAGIFKPSGKKVIKDIIYCSKDEIINGKCDLAFIINGQDLINMDIDKGFEIMDQHGLIKGQNIIIPAGLELTGTTQFGAALEYNFGDEFIKVDLDFDEDEDEYIA